MNETKRNEQNVDLSRGLVRVRPGGSRKMWQMVLFVLGGAALGLLYQRVVGCRTGTCPITSNPYIATVYGAVLGYFASGGLR